MFFVQVIEHGTKQVQQSRPTISEVRPRYQFPIFVSISQEKCYFLNNVQNNIFSVSHNFNLKITHS